MVSTGDAAANQIPSCALLHFAFTRRLFVAVADLIVACGSFSLWWMTGAPSTGACSCSFQFQLPEKGSLFWRAPTPNPVPATLKSQITITKKQGGKGANGKATKSNVEGQSTTQSTQSSVRPGGTEAREESSRRKDLSIYFSLRF